MVVATENLIRGDWIAIAVLLGGAMFALLTKLCSSHDPD